VRCSGGEGEKNALWEARSKIPKRWCSACSVQREGICFLLGCGGGVLGVQCTEGCEGCRCIWGCNAVKFRKDTVNFFLTRSNVGNKVGFGGTGDFFGGAGRSPHIFC